MSMLSGVDPSQPQTIQDEIDDLERRLREAKERLNVDRVSQRAFSTPTPHLLPQSPGTQRVNPPFVLSTTSDTHQVLSMPRLTTSSSSLQTPLFPWVLSRLAAAWNRTSPTPALPLPSLLS
jgi:hypothetical protein